MRVVTPLIVAFATAAVAAVYAKKGNSSKNCSCITTFMELEESLLQRRSNMNNLHQAFSPSNQQFPAAVDLVVHFSTSLRTTSSQGLSTARLDNNTFDYKFRWSASTVIHFVRHEVLSFSSLFVYQGTVTTAEVVIDPICKGKKMRPEQLLNSLCIQVRTYSVLPATPRPQPFRSTARSPARAVRASVRSHMHAQRSFRTERPWPRKESGKERWGGREE